MPKRRGKWRGRRSNWQSRGETVLPFQPKRHAVPDRAMDAADQLRAVMRADFKPQALLNKSEARLFKVLDKLVHKTSPLCFRADRTYREEEWEKLARRTARDRA